MGFPGGAVIKNTSANAGDTDDRVDPGSNPGSGRSHGGGNSNALQYSLLGNPMDTGTWWAQTTGSQRFGHD